MAPFASDFLLAFHRALLSAFPIPSALRQMVMFSLGENLESISAEGSLSARIYDLMRWALAHGRLDDLFHAALAEIPGNEELQMLWKRRQEMADQASEGREATYLAEREQAQRIVQFMQNRRVLYEATQAEIPRSCVTSLKDIRQFLTNQLELVSPDSPLATYLEDMRAACRNCLTRFEQLDIARDEQPLGRRYSNDLEMRFFMRALEDLHEEFLKPLKDMATHYPIEIRGELSSSPTWKRLRGSSDSNHLDLY